MANFTKRGDKWQARLLVNGKYRCKTFPTKSKAQAWAAQTETEIRQGSVINETGKTFVDALEKYGTEVSATKRGERWELIRLNAWKSLPFAHYKISDISTRILAEWRDNRLKTVKNSTVNRELNLLASVFEQARLEWQWISINPVRDVRRPQQPAHRERIFQDQERDLICAALGFEGRVVETKQHIIAVAFLFALETAMRREEITTLKWDRIFLERRVLSLPITKNGDARQVPLSTRAVELLQLVKHYEVPFDVDKDVLSTLFTRACKQAGIENARFHDARATALTRLSKILNVLELARMVGHRDIKSLQIYYRERAEDLALKLG